MMVSYMWDCKEVAFPMADGSYQTSKQEHCAPLFEALMGLAKSNAGEESDFAAGTRLDQKGAETVYIEHKWTGTHYARVEVRPSKVRASISNMAMGNHVTAVQDLSQIAAAVWYAYIAFDAKGEFKGASELTQKLASGIEEDEFDEFELELTNFEARAMTAHTPITGAEERVAVLDKKIKGPSKVISGKFVTFPSSAANPSGTGGITIEDWNALFFETDAMKKMKATMPHELQLMVPEEEPWFIPTKPGYWCFKRMHDSALYGNGEAHCFGSFGPAGSGKSMNPKQIAAKLGLPFGSIVFNKRFTMDDLKEQHIPYVVKGNVPNLSDEERTVNDALKADKIGRDALVIAREALDLPSSSEVKMFPQFAVEVLGDEFAGKSSSELEAEIIRRAQSVMLSMKAKIENSGVSHEFLGFKIHVPVFQMLYKNGGILEMAETSTADPGELAGLHNALDFSKQDYLETAYGLIKRHPCFYVFITNNTDGVENNQMSTPFLSRVQVPVWVPAPTIDETTDRLCKTLNCEGKRAKAKQIVEAFMAVAEVAKDKSLPGELDYRRLKEIGNEILVLDYDPREVFEMEVMTHFKIYSDAYDRNEDEQAMLSVLDELDLFK